MKKLISTIFLLSLITGSFASEISDHRDERFSVVADSLLKIYSDGEFKTAVLKTLQKSNTTNTDMFIKELEHVRKGKTAEEEKLYGTDNINRDYKDGMNGWSVALSGILVVYIGLILIALVVIVFNFILKEKPKKKKRTGLSVNKEVHTDPVVKVQQIIPEDHIVAISAAVELYFRLYIQGRPATTAFSTRESGTWKGGNKYGIRKTRGD